MTPALFRERIEVRSVTRTSDGMGGFVETESIAGTVMGRAVLLDVGSIGAMDQKVAERIGGRPAYQIIIHRRSAPPMRIGDVLVDSDGRRFRIAYIAQQEDVIFVTAAEI